jgi:hypothetical protein
MKTIYQEITEITNKNLSHEFEIKGIKFKTFIDWEKDFCLTHYSKIYPQGENSWCVGTSQGLKNKITILTK